MKTFALVLLGLMVVPPASAGQAVETFDQLHTLLKPGDTVRVTDTQGREAKGKIREIGPALLVIDGTWRQRRYVAEVVQAVERPGHGHAAKGAMVGAVAGFVLGVLGCQEDDDFFSCSGEGHMILGGFLAAVGTGLGAAVGAEIRSSPELVYRAAPTQSSGARLWVSPAVTARSKALVVRLTF